MAQKTARAGLIGIAFCCLATIAAPIAAQTEPAAEPAPKEEAPKDLLSNLELGEQLRQRRLFAESRDAWLRADEYVRAWEDEAKNSPEKLLKSMAEGLGSVLINDKVRRFDGADYERVALATRLSLDHLALGDWDKARTEIRKMHEREAVIAEFRAKEVEALKAEQEGKKLERKEPKDLKGYPVDTLDSPEVSALRNSYQNAFGHYLAGFVYEQAGEPSLAAAGYRQAIELRPDAAMLQDALAGLDGRVGRRSHKVTDTLLVLEAGQIPRRTSTTVPLPVPTPNGLVVVPTSFPSMPAPTGDPVPATVMIDGKPTQVSVVTNYDTMARRELKDAMPGIIVRGTIRSIAKGIINSEANKRGGFLGGLIATIVTTATEQADDRMWSGLPSHVALVRAELEPGKHRIEIGGTAREFEVMGAYSLVSMRLNPADLFMSVATTPRIEEVILQAAAEPAKEAPAVTQPVAEPVAAPSKKAKKTAAKEKAK